MGNFSVSCGVTKTAISQGDKCVFIPIVAEKHNGRMVVDGEMSLYAKHDTTHLLWHNDALWQPCLFPIHGEYNDCGGLEKIRKDENTEALENHYGLDIEDIVSVLTEGIDDVYNDSSSFFKNFFLYSEEYENGCYRMILEKLFPKRQSEIIWQAPFYNDSTFLISDVEDGFRVSLFSDIKEGKIIYREYRFNEILNFLQYYFETTGILVGMKNKKLCHELLCMGGMFVLEEVYKEFSKSVPGEPMSIKDRVIDRLFLIDNGFVAKDSGEDEGSLLYTKTVNGVELVVDEGKRTLNGLNFVNCVRVFCVAYKSLTGETLDLSMFENMDEYEVSNYFSKNYAIGSCTKLAMEEMAKIGLKVFANEKERIAKYIIEHSCCSASNYLQESFRLFGRYSIMKNVYLPAILSSKCIDAYTEMARFCHSMQLLNVVWMPSYCGTQNGCIEAEERLRNILNKIVDERSVNLRNKTENVLRNFLQYITEETY